MTKITGAYDSETKIGAITSKKEDVSKNIQHIHFPSGRVLIEATVLGSSVVFHSKPEK